MTTAPIPMDGQQVGPLASDVGPTLRGPAPTVGETVSELHRALRDYIEATYHLSQPLLVAERRDLLKQTGVIAQRPFFESTPRYRKRRLFRELSGLPRPILELFTALSQPRGTLKRLVFDPPYDHQFRAVETAIVGVPPAVREAERHHDLLVMTGTGSGKTESFLLPILGKLVNEAATAGSDFGTEPAVRALVLYPMNALVNDQLARMRWTASALRALYESHALPRRPGRPTRSDAS